MTWGSDKFGQLGVSKDGTANQWIPKRVGGVLQGICVTDMQLGLESSGVLTQDGHVYMWGNAGESEGSSGAGRLGLGHSEVQPTPVRVREALRDHCMIKISVGRYHSGAITEHGAVYMWGKGIHGQLGLGSKQEHLLHKWSVVSCAI